MINFGPFISLLLNKTSEVKERPVKTPKQIKEFNTELDKINKMGLLESIQYIKKT